MTANDHDRSRATDPAILASVRSLRLVCRLCEWGLFILLLATALAFGGVQRAAQAPLWGAGVMLVLLLLERARLVIGLRKRLGSRRVSFHATGLWITLDQDPGYGGEPSWSFDLARPVLRAGDLLLPGGLMLGLALLQSVPLPGGLVGLLNGRRVEAVAAGGWLPLSVSSADTLYGAGFLAVMLGYHVVAAVLLQGRMDRRRFRTALAIIGVLLATIGLVQLASGTSKVYGTVEPRIGVGNANIFGPFVNRNHYAAFMLLVIPLCAARLEGTWRRFRARVGTGWNAKDLLVGLDSPEGLKLIWFLVPPVVTTVSLIACNSRGGLLGFVAGLLVAGLAARGRRRLAVVAFPLLLGAVGLAWFGAERVGGRFERALADSTGRTVVWKDTLSRMEGLWLLGSGYNTFAAAMSRVTAWQLPVGATPWQEPFETSLALWPDAGYLNLEGTSMHLWYREAHNDYVQLLAETGVVGLALGLWAAARLLLRFRGDPWTLAAVTGVLCHSFVEFHLQIPAVALLFCMVSAMGPESS